MFCWSDLRVCVCVCWGGRGVVIFYCVVVFISGIFFADLLLGCVIDFFFLYGFMWCVFSVADVYVVCDFSVCYLKVVQ